VEFKGTQREWTTAMNVMTDTTLLQGLLKGCESQLMLAQRRYEGAVDVG
jgi:hypothetical protein